MATQTQTQTPQQNRQQQPAAATAAAAALVPLLAAGVTAVGLAAALATAAGVSLEVAQAIVGLAGVAPMAGGIGPALGQTMASERAYRAAYLVAAARRVQASMAAGRSLQQALDVERSNMAAHVAAVANRRRAAVLVDKAAARHGMVLGWSARMDARTSAECAAANGKNFPVSRRPVIGWPGSVHPHCRCRAVAPFAGAGMVDQVVTAAERKAAAVA